MQHLDSQFFSINMSVDPRLAYRHKMQVYNYQYRPDNP